MPQINDYPRYLNATTPTASQSVADRLLAAGLASQTKIWVQQQMK
jgi:hypothetical protein